ncbi:MAG: hypothetical protein M1818_005253 [Claussenomyces sp. TS43310]|nr:MAG: hypothetical protein M1818_005253 [Claussenomyces sp. TS43310]
MGCCASTTSSPSSPYPEPSSSSHAINSSHPVSHTAFPRPSTAQTGTSSHRQTQRSLTEHYTKPLRPHVWTSKTRRWTRQDLDREREAFFDTRVAGREEIWLTLKTVLTVLWAGGEDDNDDGGIRTAQTILEASGITIPTGDLSDGVYDSFGAFYSLPDWVVADPTNVAEDEEMDRDKMSGGTGEESDGVADEDELLRRREEKGKAVLSAEDMIKVKARLSDRGGPDVTVKIGKGDSVRFLAKSVFEKSDVSVLPSFRHLCANTIGQLSPSKHIKIVYMGKILKENESLTVQGWKEGHVVNALVFG